MDETIHIDQVVAVLRQTWYDVTSDENGFVTMDDVRDVQATYPLVFDRSRDPVPLSDVLDQIEAAGVDVSVFLQLLAATP